MAIKIKENIGVSQVITSPLIYREVEAILECNNVGFEIKRLDVICRVNQYTDVEKTKPFSLMPSFQVVLQVGDEVLVDTRNGQYVDESLKSGDDGYVPTEYHDTELNYFANQKNVSITDAVRAGIQRAYQMGRFDTN